MEKKKMTLLIFCVAAVCAGCSNKQDSAGFDRLFERLSRAKGYEESKSCYTAGTIDAVEEAVSEMAVSRGDGMSLLPRFDETTKWEEVAQKIDGPRGAVRIRYKEHPVQNMVGFVMDLQLKKEKGVWRIDLEEEVRAALRVRRERSAPGYINKIKKKY